MIEGIELLSQTEIMARPLWAHIIFFGLIGFCIVGVILLIVGVNTCSDTDVEIGVYMIVFAFICMILLAGAFPKKPSGLYRYKVTISEDVSFSDIYDNYDVIGQEGKIWILEDKESKDD